MLKLLGSGRTKVCENEGCHHTIMIGDEYYIIDEDIKHAFSLPLEKGKSICKSCF